MRHKEDVRRYISKIGTWRRAIIDHDLQKVRDRKRVMSKAEFRERLLMDLAIRR
jgi:hypothetical protein